MEYSRYKVSRDLAWQVLLHENVTRLPVMVGQLCIGMGIIVQYCKSEDNRDGFSTTIDGQPVIFVNRTCTRARQRFTAAHELRHILLGHVGKYQLVNREPSPEDNPIEHEANVFASRLLAPACVLWGCGVFTADGIAQLCEISHQSAKFRAERMERLYARNKFLSSPIEREVYERFLPFIRENIGKYQ